MPLREDVLQVLQQYKAEILKGHEEFVEPDWWHYLDDIAINVHGYGDTAEIHINLYDWFEDVGTVDMQASYDFTIEEFKKL